MTSPERHQKSFIVVHAGAGYHSAENEGKYLDACRMACAAAMQCLKSGNSAVDAVTVAVKSLEDSPCTNAGIGSNLTLDGSVECDAGVMDGKSLVFGAVGSIPGVKNPVEVAHKLVLTQLEGALTLGRIPPSVMVGAGARCWASHHGIECVSRHALITDASRKTYNKYKRKLDRANNCVQNKKYKSISGCTHNEMTSSDGLPQKNEFSNRVIYRNLDSTTSGNEISLSVTSDDSKGSSDLKNRISTFSPEVIGIQETDILQSNDKEKHTHVEDANILNTDVRDTRVIPDVLDTDVLDTDVLDTDVLDTDVQDTDVLDTDVQDTVGAVSVDQAGNVAAAASSGGIWLKQPGRLGPAAVFGAGCWARDGVRNKTPGVAVATSGCGEQLMKTLLAKQCGDALQKGDDDGSLTFKHVLEDGFLKSEFLHGVQDKNAGILGLVFEQSHASGVTDDDTDRSSSVEVLWGHTTSSMCLGYMSETHHKPRALISRLPVHSRPGAMFTVQGKLFML